MYKIHRQSINSNRWMNAMMNCRTKRYTQVERLLGGGYMHVHFINIGRMKLGKRGSKKLTGRHMTYTRAYPRKTPEWMYIICWTVKTYCSTASLDSSIIVTPYHSRLFAVGWLIALVRTRAIGSRQTYWLKSDSAIIFTTYSMQRRHSMNDSAQAVQWFFHIGPDPDTCHSTCVRTWNPHKKWRPTYHA
jgi:hypothetical protein